MVRRPFSLRPGELGTCVGRVNQARRRFEEAIAAGQVHCIFNTENGRPGRRGQRGRLTRTVDDPARSPTLLRCEYPAAESGKPPPAAEGRRARHYCGGTCRSHGGSPWSAAIEHAELRAGTHGPTTKTAACCLVGLRQATQWPCDKRGITGSTPTPATSKTYCLDLPAGTLSAPLDERLSPSSQGLSSGPGTAACHGTLRPHPCWASGDRTGPDLLIYVPFRVKLSLYCEGPGWGYGSKICECAIPIFRLY